MAKRRTDARVVRREISFQEWMAGENALRYATRQEVVAFTNLRLQEQIVPLIQHAIARYDAEQRAGRWYRRLARALVRLVGTRTDVNATLAYLDGLRSEIDEAQEDAGTVGGVGQPGDNGEPRRACVVCGSLQLEPVNALGGLKCANGHVLDDPPPVEAP